MRESAFARLIVMGVLGLGLCIPLTWVYSIVTERTARRDAAVQEVSGTWGGPQTIGGVVLSVPYTTTSTDSFGRVQHAVYRVHFLPRDLHADATVRTETRRRGIFGVIVYRTQVTLTGRFSTPDLSGVRPVPDDVDWQQATLSIGITDPRGLTRKATVRWSDRDLPLSGGVADVGLFRAGLQGRVDLSPPQPASLPFSLTLDVNGTRDLMFLPSAEETFVDARADWPHPSFVGTPLPDTRHLDRAGFTAAWHAADVARPYPARWTGADADRDELFNRAAGSAFGVIMMQPVDIYQQAERAVKYAALFIVFTFLVFFTWEIFQAALLHPVQYAFVGFALCVFYLLLVSLSEHMHFDAAYAISAAATTALISGYARAVLKGRKQAVSVFASLGLLYGFLYLLLRLEDYALLAGSVAVFVVLAALMYATRRMNWHELRLGAG